MPGDVLQVKDTGTPYLEKVTFARSGNATDGFITLQAFPGHTPILDGTGVPGDHMVLIESQSYVKLIGFEIWNHLQVNDGSGVRITGSGTHIEIRRNRIHDVRGVDAMGITVYGTSPTTPLSDLVMVGGELDINSDPTKVPRDGVCRFNQVFRARANYGGGCAAGIYVDGGRDIIIENNVVSGSDITQSYHLRDLPLGTRGGHRGGRGECRGRGERLHRAQQPHLSQRQSVPRLWGVRGIGRTGAVKPVREQHVLPERHAWHGSRRVVDPARRAEHGATEHLLRPG